MSLQGNYLGMGLSVDDLDIEPGRFGSAKNRQPVAAHTWSNILHADEGRASLSKRRHRDRRD